jgi:hypothetical protein
MNLHLCNNILLLGQNEISELVLCWVALSEDESISGIRRYLSIYLLPQG